MENIFNTSFNYQNSNSVDYKKFLTHAAQKNTKIILGNSKGNLELHSYNSLLDKIRFIWKKVKGWINEFLKLNSNRFNSVKIEKEVLEFLNYGASQHFLDDPETINSVKNLKIYLKKNGECDKLISNIVSAQKKAYVFPLGDSTLDNIYWLLNNDGSNYEQAEKNSVEGQLNTLLNVEKKTYKIKSCAYDGFTTKSVLNDDKIGRVLGIHPSMTLGNKQKAYLKNRKVTLASSSYVVHPLEKLKKLIETRQESEHYVVVSVGGNDFRELLGTPSKIMSEIPAFQQRYLSILTQIKKLKGKVRPILMFQYRVDTGSDNYGVYQTLGNLAAATQSIAMNSISSYQLGISYMGTLLEKLYQPILKQAQEDGIPILDLPNTLDPTHSHLYISQIEPSAKGGSLIAQGISHIIKKHDFESKKSILYAKTGSNAEYSGSENQGPGNWKVNTCSAF